MGRSAKTVVFFIALLVFPVLGGFLFSAPVRPFLHDNQSSTGILVLNLSINQVSEILGIILGWIFCFVFAVTVSYGIRSRRQDVLVFFAGISLFIGLITGLLWLSLAYAAAAVAAGLVYRRWRRRAV